ncbi:MAG: class I SAM-dependent methyltransferase [Deltaproteobacteria bacterium]
MPLWKPQDYDAWYATPLGKAADRIERELLFSMVDVRQGERILDAGCGTGIYSIELARRGGRVTAIDASSEMIGQARAKALKEGLNIDFIKADALRLPFPEGHFDLVISVCMLCFLKERYNALIEMKRVLRPGRRIAVALLNSQSPWALLRRAKGLVKDTAYNRADFLTPAEIELSLASAGFKEIAIRTCLFFLPINSGYYLALADTHERLGRKLFPKAGAFIVAVATKP